MTARNEFQMDPARLAAMLDELTSRLRARGVRGHIRIVGGAAMALRFPDDPEVRVTTDIDAVVEPRPEVEQVIAELAAEYGLHPGWINAAAAPWLRTDAPTAGSHSFEVIVATPEQLIAMKLAAGREQDLTDLRILARNLGIASPAELVDVAYSVYGEDAVELPDGRESYLLLASSVLKDR